jgi:hypothetical protein
MKMKFIKSPNKDYLAMGAGAGTGVLVPMMIEKYVDPMYPTGIAGMKPSVLIPIATGGLGLGIGMFTNLIKNKKLNGFIVMYGFSALVSGIVTQATQTASMSGRGMRLQAGNGCYVNTQNPYGVVSKVPSQQNIYRAVGTGTAFVAPGVIIA